MEITDEEKAVHYLSHIGYYRLSAYMYPLLSIPKEQHLFKQGVTFGKVMMLYRFDKKLRLLLFNEIEKIEVAVRCAIVNFGTEMTGNPFWMTDADNFSNPSKFNRSIRLIEDELNHTKEDFINHFKETYTNQYPPSWMLTEILPFGVITNIYSNIKNKKIKKRIAQSFGLQVAPFESWLTVITVTRNSCCHHARVWNRIFSIRATMPIRMSRPWITLPTDPLKTDSGISFLIEAEGKRLFHAGDLNNWHWKDESTPEEVAEAEQNYLKELGDLAKATDKLDATMFPVDPRIGTDFMRGAQQFVDHIKTNIFVPMHFWDRPAEVVAFRPYAELRGCRYALISVPGEGTDI